MGGAPAEVYLVGNGERLVRPLELRACRRNLRVAQRGTVRRLFARLVRRTVTNDGARTNEAGALLFVLRLLERAIDRVAVVAVDIPYDCLLYTSPSPRDS